MIFQWNSLFKETSNHLLLIKVPEKRSIILCTIKRILELIHTWINIQYNYKTKWNSRFFCFINFPRIKMNKNKKKIYENEVEL